MRTNKVIQITFCLSAVMINKLVCTLPHVVRRGWLGECRDYSVCCPSIGQHLSRGCLVKIAFWLNIFTCLKYFVLCHNCFSHGQFLNQMRHHRIRFLIREIFYTKISLNVGLVEAVAQLGLPVYLISHQWTFSFGFVKYEYIVPEMNALKTRIEHAILTITGEKLANT